MKISNLNQDEKINLDICGLPLWMRCSPQKEFKYQCKACPCSLENLKPFYSVWDALRYIKVNRGTEELAQTIEETIKEIQEGSKDTSIIINQPHEEPKTVDPDFWDYLIERADDTDHYWLDNWLEEELEYYKEHTPCPHCGSRRRYKKEIWSKTGSWVLETHEKCKNCKYRLSIEDNRPELRKGLQQGNIKQRDVKTLEKEVKSTTDKVKEGD